MNSRKHLSATLCLIFGLMAYTLAPQCAFAHAVKGPAAPRDQAEAAKWLEDALSSCDNPVSKIVIGSDTVSYWTGKRQTVIDLARVTKIGSGGQSK
jgi:hypothetical protein